MYRFPFSIILFVARSITAATLQKKPDFAGPNPRNVTFYIYVPKILAPRPAILVNPHWCHGSAQDAYAGSRFAILASTYGFIVIYPDSPNTAEKCWDVSSSQTLSHNGGGDSQGIVSMVKYALDKYNGDPDHVFVSGIGSGAMMTNVLLGSYPDVFAAGSAFAGVPFGCFAGTAYAQWNDVCAKGLVTHTDAEWADIVQAAFPGYTGYRPKMQVFHGTADEVIYYLNFREQIKEWTTVFGISEIPVSIKHNFPLEGWTKSTYGGGEFESYSAANVTHNISNQEDLVMAWFDLTCASGDCFTRLKIR